MDCSGMAGSVASLISPISPLLWLCYDGMRESLLMDYSEMLRFFWREIYVAGTR